MQLAENNNLNVGLVWKINQPENPNLIHLVNSQDEYQAEELLINNAALNKILHSTKHIFSRFKSDSKECGNFSYFQKKILDESQRYPAKVFIKLSHFLSNHFKIEELSPTAKLAYEAYCDKTSSTRTPALDFIAFSFIFLISQLENKNPTNLRDNLTYSESFKANVVSLLSDSQQEAIFYDAVDLFSNFLTDPIGLAILKSFWEAEFTEKLLSYSSLIYKAWNNGDICTYFSNCSNFFEGSVNNKFFEETEDYFNSRQKKKSLEELVAISNQNDIDIKKDLESIEVTRKSLTAYQNSQNDNDLSSYTRNLNAEYEELKQEIDKNRIELINKINKHLLFETEPLSCDSNIETIIEKLKLNLKYFDNNVEFTFMDGLGAAFKIKAKESSLDFISKRNELLISERHQLITKRLKLIEETEEYLNEKIYSLQRKLETHLISIKAKKLERAELLPLQDKIDTLFAENASALLIANLSNDNLNQLQFYCKSKGYVIEQIVTPMRSVGFCWEVVNRASGRKGTLLGTIHRCSKKVLDLNSQILKRFNEADIIAVEIDITRKDIVKKIRKHLLGRFKSIFVLDDGLKHIHFFRTFFEKYSIALPKNKENQLDNYLKTFIKFLVEKAGIDEGIETFLIPQAKEQEKPVIDLEVFEDQISIINEKWNDFSWSEILDENFNFEESIEKYKQGFNESEQFLNLELAVKWGYEELMSSFLDKLKKEEIESLNFRNLKMTIKITELMKSHNSPFIMVGALHFPGEMGLINLLEKSGYSCERIIVYEPSIFA